MLAFGETPQPRGGSWRIVRLQCEAGSTPADRGRSSMTVTTTRSLQGAVDALRPGLCNLTGMGARMMPPRVPNRYKCGEHARRRRCRIVWIARRPDGFRSAPKRGGLALGRPAHVGVGVEQLVADGGDAFTDRGFAARRRTCPRRKGERFGRCRLRAEAAGNHPPVVGLSRDARLPRGRVNRSNWFSGARSPGRPTWAVRGRREVRCGRPPGRGERPGSGRRSPPRPRR